MSHRLNLSLGGRTGPFSALPPLLPPSLSPKTSPLASSPFTASVHSLLASLVYIYIL